MPPLPPVLPGTPSSGADETPVDRALALALAGEREAAMRWAAAVVREDPIAATALLVCGNLLGEAGRHEVAREACTIAVERAIDLENLPLAVAAAREVAHFGGDEGPLLDHIAESFGRGSPRRGEGATPPAALPSADAFQPLPSVLTGVALINRATEIVHEAKRKLDEVEVRPGLREVPLFGELDAADLRSFIGAMVPVWVGTDLVVVAEDEAGDSAYFVARGTLEAVREGGGDTTHLARLGAGDLFGEMALLSRSPRIATVRAVRPSIALRMDKVELDRVAEAHPAVGDHLAQHCRQRMIQNLLRTSDVLHAVPPGDHSALVAKFEVQVFERGDSIIVADEQPTALYLIASGAVQVVRPDDDGDPLVISTLGPGEVVGEVAMILRRHANAHVVALHPTVVLALPSDGFLSLIEDHPSILAGLYLLAVRRDDEMRSILSGEVDVADVHDLEFV